MAVLIKPGVLRDVSYVLGNLRPGDEREVRCLIPDGTKMYEVAWNQLQASRECYVAYRKDQPAMTFGVCQGISCASLIVWALGTPQARMVIPAVSRFMVLDVLARYVDAGYVSMEARSIATHVEAHRWMRALGAVAEGKPYPYGKGGERFITFRWTKEKFPTIRARYLTPGTAI